MEYKVSRPKNPTNSGPIERRPSAASTGDDEQDHDAISSQRTRSFASQFVRKLTFHQHTQPLQPCTPPSSSGTTGNRPRRNSFHNGVGNLGLTCVYDPPEALVDLIFVHGLHGGSLKTWRAKPEPGYFWPGEWLPQDPEFKYVRIHTFGYPANWTDFQESQLSVSNFGESLRSHLLSSTHLNRGARTPIVLVGHSMGGLVIKKACLAFKDALEEDDPNAFAHRIKCLMFLATPHHGSDSAERLDKILRAGAGPVGAKDYLKDLKKGALSNQTINAGFKFIADRYMLYSFYETRPMNQLGLIVDIDAACIGGPKHENTVMMTADHRSICKFESEDDSCFRTFKDHLIMVLDELFGREMEPTPNDLAPIETYLDCEDSRDEMLETVLAPKVQGSCRWIESHEDFNQWRQDTSRQHWLYWMHAPPGTGKSVLSASVFRMLSQENVFCFFFVNGNKKRNTVSGMLRTIALQMARKHPGVKNALRELQRNSIQLDDTDEKLVWRKLFVNCIFKVPLAAPQFWVIDALDECSDFGKLFPLLKIASSNWPTLRIFLTSRPSPEIRSEIRSLSGPNFRTFEDGISPEDTNSDIEQLLKTHRDALPVDDADLKNELLRRIARDSQGSFLWAKVVLKEMEKAIDSEEIDNILAEVPSDMMPQYQSILENMSMQTTDDRRKAQIKAFLTWAVCCVRPLTEAELQAGLPLDTDSKLSGIVGSISRTVEKLCGQLLMVNKQGAVQVVHSTVREFLLSRTTTSEFAIRKEEGHLRLAKVCLKYLAGKEMQPARGNKMSKRKGTLVERTSAFAAYATTNFSVHLVNCRPENDEVFEAIHTFLAGNNVLTWIEYIARRFNSLDYVKEAGANIRRFVERRSKHVAPVGPEYSLVQNWGIDLIRIVAKFGHHLLFAPESIATLLPAVCPTTSSIRRQYYSERASDLRVVGLSDEFWFDAISYIEHTQATASAIAVGAKFVAIGKSSGMVRIFSATTYIELFTLQHGEEVTAVSFNSVGDHLITSGNTLTRFWAMTELDEWEPIWTRTLEHPCTKFSFDDQDQILATTSNNSLLVWRADGEDEDDDDCEVTLGFGDAANQDQDKSLCVTGPPTCSSFSPDGLLVALAHGGKISLWQIEGDEPADYVGTWERDSSPEKSPQEVEAMLFNPNPDLEFMVATYRSETSEGQLVLYDYSRMELAEVRSVTAEPYALSATPDGQTLATGDRRGNIQIWDFESLTQLYVIKYNSFAVRELAFSHDGKRLLDLRQTHSVVWEPAVLVRNHDEEDDASTSGTSVALPQPTAVSNLEDPREITATALHPDISVAFVGKEDGGVRLYDLIGGRKIQDLVALQSGRAITHLAFGNTDLLACGDSTGAVAVAKIAVTLKARSTEIDTVHIGKLQWLNPPSTEPNTAVPMVQLVFNNSGRGLVVANRKTTQIWILKEDGTMELTSSGASPADLCWRFTPCEDNQDQFQLVDKPIEAFINAKGNSGNDLRVGPGYGNSRPSERLKRSNTDDSAVSAQSKNGSSRVRRVLTDPDTGYVVVEYAGARATTQLVILERTSSAALAEQATPVAVDVQSMSPGLLAPPQFPINSPPSPSEPASPLDRRGSAGSWSDSFRMLEHLRPHQIRMFLGVWNGKAVYLGPQLWVRTVDLHHLAYGAKSLRRKHFFIPHEYLGGNHNVQARVGNKGEVIFPRRGELAVVWGGIGKSTG
ncbi:uncharacterized protein PgNI_05039 [Pyricularia grisea]|uniref:GPI inositol-deacylase n=1 Tax=Pyricularia grisea TaxID=148305 RepID=A0A6P8BCV7_PYRGI|nr:uncharacterized protein PgNI_05039 [Pyricularia grisea]TLD13706.1 hypothetical protein PgNI_05039 [Pyricularia grisea]